MFTGLINGVATIVAIKKNKNVFSYTANFPFFLCNTLKVGASVAYNGCCLTIKYIDNFKITCDVIEETLKITNLGQLNIGDRVNIERSAKYGDEIGGHIVSGHILNTVIVSKIITSDKNYTLWLKINDMELMKYIFYKGFICIDGVSLTVGKILKNEFCVHLIPQTLLDTTISERKKNDVMNIEIDHHTQIVVDTTERIIRQNIEII